MKKQTIIILTAIILVIVAAIVCFTPRITRFDEVMTAVKIDAKGNQLGTVNFRVQASKYDFLFGQSKLSCWIPDFDTLKSFERKENVSQNSEDYCFAVIGASTDQNTNIMCDLYSSPDLTRWLLWNLNDNTFYVASSDPNLTTAELVSYFNRVNKIPVSLTEPNSDANRINWNLDGTWISADGTASSTATGSIFGNVQLGDTGEDTLDLNITFTEGCNYQYTNPTSYSSESRKYLKVPYCVCPLYSYSKDKNASVFSYIGISLDKEYVIFHWEDQKDLYLVASTDPDTDPKDILSYFEVFVQTYPSDK